MNKQFGFILGRESELSKAEIFCVLKKFNAEYQIILNTKEVLIIETDKLEIDINKLGGTIKLFKVLGSDLTKEKVKNFVQNNIEIGQAEKRVNFGISGYGYLQSNFIYAIGKNVKDKLVSKGLKARFVVGKFKDLSSVIVHENKLIERGFEAIIIENKNKYFVGQTIAVQDYKAYSKRDFGRTARDDKSGMLPPKLAQIMINLSSKTENCTLYDPFCGSGTVLQEAILLGFEKVIGSDISERAIEDTKNNLKWLASSNVISSEAEKSRSFGLAQDDSLLFVSDVLSPAKNTSADVIVGEGFLGDPVRRNVTQAKDDAKKLGDFYLKAFTNLGRILEDNGRIVIAIPYFIIGKERIFLPILDKLGLTGLKQIEIPNVTMTLRQSLLYARPDAFVGREILILEKA